MRQESGDKVRSGLKGEKRRRRRRRKGLKKGRKEGRRRNNPQIWRLKGGRRGCVRQQRRHR